MGKYLHLEDTHAHTHIYIIYIYIVMYVNVVGIYSDLKMHGSEFAIVPSTGH